MKPGSLVTADGKVFRGTSVARSIVAKQEEVGIASIQHIHATAGL